MKNDNRIFNALSGLDDSHFRIDEAESLINIDQINEKRKLSKSIKIALIAVTAAALTLLVGFTASTVSGKHKFGFYKEGSADHEFDLKLAAYDIKVPDDFIPEGDLYFSDWFDTQPGELFEMFGLTLPINDNFTEINGKKTGVRVSIAGDVHVDFDYWLYNKTIDSEVNFETRYFSNVEKLTYQANRGLLPGEPTEVVTLKDGSLCMVSGSMAALSLNGAHCELELPYNYEVPENYEQLSKREQYRIIDEMIEAMPGIDTVKQVLADLGVYDLNG